MCWTKYRLFYLLYSIRILFIELARFSLYTQWKSFGCQPQCLVCTVFTNNFYWLFSGFLRYIYSLLLFIVQYNKLIWYMDDLIEEGKYSFLSNNVFRIKYFATACTYKGCVPGVNFVKGNTSSTSSLSLSFSLSLSCARRWGPKVSQTPQLPLPTLTRSSESLCLNVFLRICFCGCACYKVGYSEYGYFFFL